MKPACLFVVATPIGNLEDLSDRARRTLKEVAFIYAEDTRHSRFLLTSIGTNATLRSLHEHNQRARQNEIRDLLAQGFSIALITDAGTPAVSDPGAQVIHAMATAGFKISPIVGPSALAAALSVCGFVANEKSSENVLFFGFLPRQSKDLEQVILQMKAHLGLVVFFESPQRITEQLQRLAGIMPNRQACLCRELTKVYEEIRRGTIAELIAWAQEQPPRGEITVVLGAKDNSRPKNCIQNEDDLAFLNKAVNHCLNEGLSARDVSIAFASILDKPRQAIYKLCLSVKNNNESQR